METQLIPLLQLVFHPVTTTVIIELLVVVLLLVCSALVSGSEVAFFSLTPTEKEGLQEKNNRRTQAVMELLKKPEDLLANILISNNFVNVGIVILASFITTTLMDASAMPVLGFIIQVVIITFVILLFGEILPKIYADRFSDSFASVMSIPLRITGRLFRPLIFLLTKSTSLVNKRMSGKRKNISMDDLSEALDIATGVISDEKKMLEGIVKFSNLEASEIMKPRMDVVNVEIKTSMEELIRVVIESGYSRIPVYEESTDNIMGILYVKDLLPHIRKTHFNWQTLIRPPFFVPETKKINDLLQEFQQTKIHLAIVVDEYGGMKGIVTMEDILEEVVGEITDESDEAEEFYRKLDKNTYLFDGKTLLNDFFKVTELDADTFEDVRGDAETLAGLILELKGDFPKINDSMNCKHIRFTITDMDKRRIKQIRVRINDEEKNDA
ncbi:MAG: gliding motility-associated protein GldE [Bacteroidales bacterium]|nr:gliding motility-associated protein GldE [Bacteroidales bacterium]MDT8431909.1 gliding motility-associated protein GldE [Bacteroidales bacterium]